MLLGTLLVLGCNTEPLTPGIRLLPNLIAGVQAKATVRPEPGALQTALRLGSPPATRLRSLKYLVASIQLCQGMELLSNGLSAGRGCIELYHSDAELPDYYDYAVTQAREDDSTERYVDLLDPSDQARLQRKVSLNVPVPDPSVDTSAEPPAAVYEFGLLNFYKPIKVTAEFPIVGQAERYFRTRAVTEIVRSRTLDGRFENERVQIGDTLSGPTEETIYMLDYGAVLFNFHKPFTITQSDVAVGTEFSIDLVWNPDNFGQAYEAPGCSRDPYNAICDPLNGVAIDMPYVRLNAVPRKTGERTRKETYLMEYTSSAKLRIELYYNDGDPQATVQGVDVAVVYTANVSSTTYNIVASNFVSQSGSVASADANVALLDHQRSPTLDGLIRRRSGTATIHCIYSSSVCPSAGESLPRAYSFVGDVIVASDD